MAKYVTESIRSVALVGHANSGKTTLAEALLVKAGAITTAGTVEKGNTVCDFDPLEKTYLHSLNTSLVSFADGQTNVHLLDTPGYPDFIGQGICALAAVETALVVVNAQNGIELNTRRMMKWSEGRGLCRMIVVNKIDADNLDLAALLADIQETFGKQCLPINLPAHGRADVVDCFFNPDGDADFSSVASAHSALVDQVVEVDEELMALYLEQGSELAPEQLHAPFEKALREGHLIPVLFVSAKSGAGLPQLMEILEKLAPNPAEGNPPPFYRGEPGDEKIEEFHSEPDAAKHVLAHVFKVIVDPYVGKLGVFRVYQGTIRKDSELFVGDARRPFKVGHLFVLQGKDYVETDELVPGDIGAVAKVDEIAFDAVLHDSHDEDHIHLKPLEFPVPVQGVAVDTKKKGDEQRLFDVLHKLELEDPTFKVERHPTTNETVLRGLGDLHLRSKLEKMSSQYKLEVTTRPPTIPYQETITKLAECTYRHKKQTGGAGQFGEVALKVEPLPRGAGFEFVDHVKGGVIPGVFMPAVEKGVLQALEGGIISGFPVHDVRVTVFDGKHHPVDSKEIAFVTAGRKATLEAVRSAGAIILEPIVNIEITVPEAHVGDITSDLSSRRGHVTGTDGRGASAMAVTGQVPLSELDDYPNRLRAMTAGHGSYLVELSHYDPVPLPTQQKLMAGFKGEKDED